MKVKTEKIKNQMNKKSAYLKYVFALALAFLMSSCIAFKKSTILEDQIALTQENLSLLNGTYLLNSDKYYPISMEYFFGSYFSEKQFNTYYHSGRPSIYVSLRVVNEQKVHAVITADNIVLKSYYIRGKLKNGYFEQNRKVYIIPAFLLNTYHSSKFRIGMLNTGNIITDYKMKEFGTYYFFYPFSDSSSSIDIEHTRLK